MNELPTAQLIAEQADRITDHLAKLTALCEMKLAQAINAADYKEAFAVFYATNEANKSLDAARKALGAAYERMNKQTIPELFETLGTDMYRVPELERSFYPLVQTSASMVDKDAGMEWLRENGGSELIQPTVNASTLKSFLSELLSEEGVEPPADLIKVSSYTIVGSSKYTPKDK